MSSRILQVWSAAVVLTTLAACGTSTEETPARFLSPDKVFLGYNQADPERVEVCKQYVMKTSQTPPTTTSFTISGGGQSKTVSIATGTCSEVVLYGGTVVGVTVTENVPAGFTPSYVQVTDIGGVDQSPVGPISSNVGTGFVGGNGGPYSASTGELFRFTNTEEVRTTGCTVTQGYWKTHSSKGPAPYDNAWLNIGAGGENTLFFASGKTWYQVFWTSPQKGNANYILAHQYMAAKLNILAGASSTPAVDAAITGAEAYFPGITNLDVLPVNPTRAQLLAWAGTLDDYNNGLTGPGHCN